MDPNNAVALILVMVFEWCLWLYCVLGSSVCYSDIGDCVVAASR